MDTDVNELTVIPWRLVAPSNVTIATPVANLPRLPRKWWAGDANVLPAVSWAPPDRGVAIIIEPLDWLSYIGDVR
jgi:hypothetical protein